MRRCDDWPAVDCPNNDAAENVKEAGKWADSGNPSVAKPIPKPRLNATPVTEAGIVSETGARPAAAAGGIRAVGP
jgi:hypothetical protein